MHRMIQTIFKSTPEGMWDAGDGWSGIDVGHGGGEVMVGMAVVVLIV